MTFNYINYAIFSSLLLTFREDASRGISGGGTDVACGSLRLARRTGLARGSMFCDVGATMVGGERYLSRGYEKSELQHLPFLKNISTLEPSRKN